MKTVFEYKDLVLPIIKLPDPCPIYLEISDDIIGLSIGQRDFEWDRKTGKLNGAGTML
jgi:hypothetical protein